MVELLDAHPLTLVIVSAAVMVTPLHLMATFVFSGASARMGAKLPAIFAIPAGIGDIAVAALAAGMLWHHRRAAQLPARAVMAVAVLGAADFASAFFFGFLSSTGPQQLFFPEVRSDALLYPTGMIPLFLVPYAIAFHTLSVLALRDRARAVGSAGAMAANPA